MPIEANLAAQPSYFSPLLFALGISLIVGGGAVLVAVLRDYGGRAILASGFVMITAGLWTFAASVDVPPAFIAPIIVMVLAAEAFVLWLSRPELFVRIVPGRIRARAIFRS